MAPRNPTSSTTVPSSGPSGPLTPEEQQALIAAAREAAAHAYCPYSGFAVGAALAAADGRIFRGTNVENASYGLTLCAERAALAAAVAAGARHFRALAIVTSGASPASPCGACRQVLAEFARTLPVLSAAATGPVRSSDLAALLPDAFRL